MAPAREAETADEPRSEVRRLRAQVHALEEEKRALEQRLSHLIQELEKTRAKVPKGISTS